MVDCAAGCTFFLGIALVWFLAACALVPVVRPGPRPRGERGARGCCDETSRLYWPTRKALMHLWVVLRLWALGTALALYLSAGFFSASLRDNGDHQRDMLFAATSLLVFLALLPTYRNRQRIHALLGRCASPPEERQAAAIAALIGGMPHEHVMQLAQSSFLVLPWGVLSLDHFASSGDTGLSRLAVPAALGSCDAFISHSWHDLPEPKWRALQSWAAEFSRRIGREPLMWWKRLPSQTQPCPPPPLLQVRKRPHPNGSTLSRPFLQAGQGLHRPDQHRRLSRCAPSLPGRLFPAPGGGRAYLHGAVVVCDRAVHVCDCSGIRTHMDTALST